MTDRRTQGRDRSRRASLPSGGRRRCTRPRKGSRQVHAPHIGLATTPTAPARASATLLMKRWPTSIPPVGPARTCHGQLWLRVERLGIAANAKLQSPASRQRRIPARAHRERLPAATTALARTATLDAAIRPYPKGKTHTGESALVRTRAPQAVAVLNESPAAILIVHAEQIERKSGVASSDEYNVQLRGCRQDGIENRRELQ
jgi:hypothetical protein